MRRLAYPVVAFAVLSACGTFDSSDSPDSPPPPDPAQEKEKANENATPPVVGAALDGVFVSSSRGKDTNDGTADAPLATLAAGIKRAKEFGKRVIACAEDYAEAVTVVSGVSMFGAFDCSVSPWAKSEKRAVVRAPSSPALQASNIPLRVRIDGFEIIAPDLGATAPKGPGAPSIGVRLEDVIDFELANVRVKAGTGAPGEDGEDPAPPATPASATGSVGRAQGTSCVGNICALRTYNPGGVAGNNPGCGAGAAPGVGGDGGTGIWYTNGIPQNGHNELGLPYAATAQTAQGATAAVGVGTAGARGAVGSNGTNATGFTFDATGAFSPASGAPGGPGAGGQGGGGGGAAIGYIVNGVAFSYAPASAPQYYFASTGGGGGAGGCGGLPGTGGHGGGASVALLSLKSQVAAFDVRLEASIGGPGGKGALGTLGSAGGGGGAGGSAYAGAGGMGGEGGPAGLSGHGATGPSIAMVFFGKAPSGALTLLPGSSGPGQKATTRTVGNETQTMPAAPPGEALETYEIAP
ncbi:MAG: hypothetical protein KC657_23175 [Myxococcales bacterium]|nr:hypothetical protein [Myxococcales bacterium]